MYVCAHVINLTHFSYVYALYNYCTILSLIIKYCLSNNNSKVYFIFAFYNNKNDNNIIIIIIIVVIIIIVIIN